MKGQIGLEVTVQEYLDRLVRVFQEVRRVLRQDGTVWLVIGDSYCTDSSNSVVQERYITLSVHRKTIEEARTFFDRVTADVTTRLSHLDAVERLRVLHDFYRTGEETEFHVDLRDLMRKGHSFKDTICPDSLEFRKDYFVMGGKYGRVLFLKEYASYIKDRMISELTALNRTMMLSIDMIPVPTDEAAREMQSRLLGVETNVTNRLHVQ